MWCLEGTFLVVLVMDRKGVLWSPFCRALTPLRTKAPPPDTSILGIRISTRLGEEANTIVVTSSDLHWTWLLIRGGWGKWIAVLCSGKFSAKRYQILHDRWRARDVGLSIFLLRGLNFFLFFFCSSGIWTQGLQLELLHQTFFFVMGFSRFKGS
jgi:hypothetical protein